LSHFISSHFILFYFVSNSNKPFNVFLSKKILLLVVDVFWYSSSGRHLGLCTFRFLIPWYYISCHIGDNVLFKFRGVEKTYCFFLFVCLFFFFCINFLNFLFFLLG
jgi:hypothetical protein